MEFLQEMYRECNEHLRHTDSKRDQLLVFYAAVVGIFFNAVDKLKDVGLFTPALIFLVLFGVCLLAACIWYWRWHYVYGKTLCVLRNLIFSGDPFVSRTLEQHWQRCSEHIKPGPRTEFFIFLAYVSISAFPLYALLRHLLGSYSPACPVLLTAIYGLLVLLAAYLCLNKKDLKKPDASWFFKCINGQEAQQDAKKSA